MKKETKKFRNVWQSARTNTEKRIPKKLLDKYQEEYLEKCRQEHRETPDEIPRKNSGRVLGKSLMESGE